MTKTKAVRPPNLTGIMRTGPVTKTGSLSHQLAPRPDLYEGTSVEPHVAIGPDRAAAITVKGKPVPKALP